MANLPILPTRTRVLDENGHMTKPWLDALQGSANTANNAASDASAAKSNTATPPGVVTGIFANGVMDPVQGIITLTVSVTPPSDAGDTFAGCHLYLEIPDQSAQTAQVVGQGAVGNVAVTGTWKPIDLGKQPYVSSQQPWQLTISVPSGIDPTVTVQCRLYAVSYSNKVENPLIQATQTGASPNHAFTLTSAPGVYSTAGTSVTATAGGLLAVALPPDNTTGKLKTPVQVSVASVPTNIAGWCYQIVLTLGASDPTKAANQFIVTGLQTVAGPVPATSPDGISTPHTFTLDTPATVQSGTVWLQSGLVDGNGNFTPNAIVPGITPSFPISYGSTTGTVDMTQAIIASVNATMAVTAGLFGVANNGIATINLQNLAVTNPVLASLAVDAAKLASSSVDSTKIANLAVGNAALQNACVTNAIIANGAISDAKIQTATITNASIATGTIGDAQIGTCGVSKLVAGTATFSGTAIFQYSSTGPQVAINSTNITLTQGSGSAAKLSLTASNAVLTNNGTDGITLDATNGCTITASGGALTTTINGNAISTGSITTLGTGLLLTAGTISFPPSQTATTVGAAGAASALPAAPVGYIKITISGTTYKLPYYNN